MSENMQDWQQEQINLDTDINKFHYFQTPHHQCLIYCLNSDSHQLKVFQNKEETHTWESDLIRNEEIQGLQKDFPTEQIFNFTMFFDNKGDLGLILNTVDKRSEIQEYNIYYCTSTDYGKAWQKCTRINPEYESWIIDHPPIILHTGTQVGNILLPIENAHTRRALTLLSTDNGKTWNFSLYIEPSEDIQDDDAYNEMVQLTSPAIFETIEGFINCTYWISTTDQLHTSQSKDRGITWRYSKNIDIQVKSHSNYYLLKYISANHQVTSDLYLLGLDSDNGDLFVKLWKSTDALKNFNLKFISPVKYKPGCTNGYLQLYQDFDDNVHLLMQSPENLETITHYWCANEKLSLDS